jgi:hypothetical protein
MFCGIVWGFVSPQNLRFCTCLSYFYHQHLSSIIVSIHFDETVIVQSEAAIQELEDPAWYPELNSFDPINRRQVMRTCPSTGRARRCGYLTVVRGKNSTRYKVKGRITVMRTKMVVRDWLRERGLPIFDAEDRIRMEDGFNANFSVVDDPTKSLNYEGRPPPPQQPQQPQQQQVEHELGGGGEVLGGAARHTDEQQQKDEISDQASEGPSAFWGIPGFSAILRDCPPVDSDEICNLDRSNDVDLMNLDGVLGWNNEVTSPSSLPPVDSGARTPPSVVLGRRQQFLAASMRYFMCIVGSAKKQLKGCDGTRQQMLLTRIESNLQMVKEVQRCILR